MALPYVDEQMGVAQLAIMAEADTMRSAGERTRVRRRLAESDRP